MKASDFTTHNPSTAVQAMSRKLYGVAEQMAYDSASSSKGAVQGDAIYDAAAKLLQQIEQNVVEMIQREHMDMDIDAGTFEK